MGLHKTEDLLHSTSPIRIAINKNTTNRCCKDVGKKKPSYTGGMQASAPTLEKQYGGFLKI
jgi:hypothetical protein